MRPVREQQQAHLRLEASKYKQSAVECTHARRWRGCVLLARVAAGSPGPRACTMVRSAYQAARVELDCASPGSALAVSHGFDSPSTVPRRGDSRQVGSKQDLCFHIRGALQYQDKEISVLWKVIIIPKITNSCLTITELSSWSNSRATQVWCTS